MNKDIKQFKKYQEEYRQFIEYVQRQKKQAEMLEYDVVYGQIDRHVGQVDMRLMEDRFIRKVWEEEKEQLLLDDINRVQKHVRNIVFDKQPVRNICILDKKNDIDVVDGQQLQRDQIGQDDKYRQVDKKVKGDVKMREIDVKGWVEQQGLQQNDIIYDVDYQCIDKKVKGNVKMKEDNKMQQLVDNQDEHEERVVEIKHDMVKPRIKQGVKMDRGDKRFKDTKSIQKDKQDQKQTEEVIDVAKNMEVVKERHQASSWGKQSGRDDQNKKRQQIDKKLQKNKVQLDRQKEKDEYYKKADRKKQQIQEQLDRKKEDDDRVIVEQQQVDQQLAGWEVD